MEDKKVSMKQVIAIGGAFMGFVIGSSFASGQECMQYFTGFGAWKSVGAGLIALLLYVWFVSTIVEDGRYLRLNNSGKMFNFYLGKYLGFALEWFTPIMLFFVYSMMILNFGLLANISAVYDLEIPSLFVAASISPIFGDIFSVMLLLGIYTTAVPMLYTVCNKISSDSKSWAYRITAIVTAIVSIFGGQLSFSTMISIIYPISGYAGLVIFAGMIYTKYIKKRKYEDFDENNVLLKKKSA